MRKRIILLLMTVFTLFVCFSLGADKKGRKWIDTLIELSVPHGTGSATSIPGRWGGIDQSEHLDIAILNINAHLQEIARLRHQGLTESEIQSRIAANIPSSIANARTGSISGAVTEKGGGRVQYYTSIYAYNEFGCYCGYASVFPNANTNYRIKNLAPGKYYVRVESSYYQDKYYRNTTDWKKAKLVHVAKNKQTRNINFKLESQKGLCCISGQVRRKDRTPLMDCDIYAYDLDWNFYKSAKTDVEGRYSVQNLPAGDYKLQCSYEESDVNMQIWYGNTMSYADAAVLSLSDEEHLTGIDFVLDYGGTIEGKIYGSSGRPVKANECSVHACDMKQNYVQYATTDDKGQFVLPALPKGRYKLLISYWGSDNYLGCWYKNAKNFKDALPINIAPLQKERVSVTLKPAGMITGTVGDSNGQPLKYYYCCSIDVYDEDYRYVKSVRTDENGSFAIKGLASGRYKVYADYKDYSYGEGPSLASEWYGGKYFAHEAPFVRVIAPKTTAHIDFSLEQGGSITGTVSGRDAFIPEYEVEVYAFNKMWEYVGASEMSGYYNSYEISGLPTGEYKLWAFYYGDEDYSSEWYENGHNFGSAKKVSVTAPNTTGNIDFVLDYGGLIRGFVTDTKNNRLTEENNIISLDAYDALTGEYADSESNNFVGGYQFNLLEGMYKFAAVSYYANWLSGPEDLAVGYHLYGKNFGDPNTSTFSILPGSSAAVKTLALEKANGSISGTIYHKNSGLPVTSTAYSVLVFDEYGYLAGLSLYSEYYGSLSGEYRVGGLRPGLYYVLAIAIGEGSGYYYDFPAQWYNGIGLTMEEKVYLVPKMDIPAGALSVSVGTGATGGINFFMDLPKKK